MGLYVVTCQYGLTDIYFVLWVVIQHYFVLLLTLLHLWISGGLSFSFCPFGICPIIVGFLGYTELYPPNKKC